MLVEYVSLTFGIINQSAINFQRSNTVIVRLFVFDEFVKFLFTTKLRMIVQRSEEVLHILPIGLALFTLDLTLKLLEFLFIVFTTTLFTMMTMMMMN